MTLHVQARRFRCLNPACLQQTFAERLSGTAPAAARRTERLGGLQRHLGLALGGEAGSAARVSLKSAKAELLTGFAYLETLPLSNEEISREVGRAAQAWAGLQAALSAAGTPAGQDSIAALSETLLASIDRLTEHLERGMQALIR